MAITTFEDYQRGFRKCMAQMMKESFKDVIMPGSFYERKLRECDDTKSKKDEIAEKCQKILKNSKMAKAKGFVESLLETLDDIIDFDTPFKKIDALYKLCCENEEKDDEDKTVNESEEDDDQVDEADDDDEPIDPDIDVMKSSYINDYKLDKVSIYKMLKGFEAFGEWILIHGKNEERPIMKALLAVLADEYIPKFAEVPGADDASEKKHAGGDGDETDDTETPTDSGDDADAADSEEDDDLPPEDDAADEGKSAEDEEEDGEEDEETNESTKPINESWDEIELVYDYIKSTFPMFDEFKDVKLEMPDAGSNYIVVKLSDPSKLKAFQDRLKALIRLAKEQDRVDPDGTGPVQGSIMNIKSIGSNGEDSVKIEL